MKIVHALLLAVGLSFFGIGCDGSPPSNTEGNVPDTISSGRDGFPPDDPTWEPPSPPDQVNPPDQVTPPPPDQVNPPDQVTPPESQPEPQPEKADTGGLGVSRRALSGARLKIQFVQGDDGSKHFVGWYDMQLSTPCTWRQAKTFDTSFSNAYYCVPDTKLIGLGLGIFYIDPECKQAIAVRQACQQSTHFGVLHKNQSLPICSPEVECHGLALYQGEDLYSQGANGCQIQQMKASSLRNNGATVHYSLGRCVENDLLGSYATGQIKLEP